MGDRTKEPQSEFGDVDVDLELEEQTTPFRSEEAPQDRAGQSVMKSLGSEEHMQRYVNHVRAADADMRELLEEMKGRLESLHNERLEPNDPLLMAMSANLLIVQQSVRSTKALQDEVLRAHRSELELLSARWQRDADAIGLRIVSRVLQETSEEAGQAAQRACSSASVRIEQALKDHQRQLLVFLWTGSAVLALSGGIAAVVRLVL